MPATIVSAATEPKTPLKSSAAPLTPEPSPTTARRSTRIATRVKANATPTRTVRRTPTVTDGPLRTPRKTKRLQPYPTPEHTDCPPATPKKLGHAQPYPSPQSTERPSSVPEYPARPSSAFEALVAAAQMACSAPAPVSSSAHPLGAARSRGLDSISAHVGDDFWRDTATNPGEDFVSLFVSRRLPAPRLSRIVAPKHLHDLECLRRLDTA